MLGCLVDPTWFVEMHDLRLFSPSRKAVTRPPNLSRDAARSSPYARRHGGRTGSEEPNFAALKIISIPSLPAVQSRSVQRYSTSTIVAIR